MSFKLDIMEAIKREDYSRVKEILLEDDDDQENSNLADTDGCTPLILASILGNLEICQLLINKKVDLNRKDKIKGWTALMQACFFRYKFKKF
uniref:Uncharacterized protein n=1 Tax=Romanomermis culicivorax TaxID=13658 RepID=A0A915LB06_ROMCU